MLFASSRLFYARQGVVLRLLKETPSAWISATSTATVDGGDEGIININNNDSNRRRRRRRRRKGNDSMDAAGSSADMMLLPRRPDDKETRKSSEGGSGVVSEGNLLERVSDDTQQSASLSLTSKTSSPSFLLTSANPTEGIGAAVAVPSSTPPRSSLAPRTGTDHALQLHRQFSSEMHQQPHVRKGETVASDATYAANERIERRRKKWTVSEAEFDAGITERLFPEIRRLSALHELHYGDAIMREVDAATYFAFTAPFSSSTSSAPFVTAAAVDGEEEAVELLSDADFIEFESTDTQRTTMARTAAAAAAAAATETTLSVDNNGREFSAGEQEEDKHSPAPVAADDKTVVHGMQTPWFIPQGGVVRLEPLSLSDTLCTLHFVMHLRQQTPKQLSLALQKRVKSAEALLNTSEDKVSNATTTTLLSLEDVLVYLDTAPPPIIGFTENLPPSKSPAFVFVLYTENVSLQNAIAHMAALFSIPQRAFHTHTAVSKMSCGAILCAVAPNFLQREHLLLLNTMRHPGFVLRVGSIRAVEDPGRCKELFGELSRWEPLHEVELLLRRVSCTSRQELQHRLSAVQEVGAVFFCANRESSLARAATDVLHGFFKSALLNALYRRSAPIAMRQFLSRPNVITAARARRASTDAVVRQVLKIYILVDGDWEKAVARTPYVWRRRWLNALRCSLWNSMASRRMRHGGRSVLPGDVVLRPEYRADAHRRMLTTVKSEHVMVVRDAEEASQCSVEDVFIPFLRGIYPPELFAPDTTNHPIMTRANMLALLREAHAPQLLLGMSNLCQQLLDIRNETSPLLFRRFILRPVAMSFTILEDKAPMKSVHFDAARVLVNDRLRLQQHLSPVTTRGEEVSAAAPAAASVFLTPPSLLNQSVVLERTTIGARLSSGLLAEEFFAPPTRDEYVALGHVERHLHGNFVLAPPLATDDSLKSIDRVFSIHVHAVVRHGVAALGQLLREYFILGGVEREDDSALQHKIHRVRRELDTETQRLTAPTFCSACYCCDHDTLDVCAEYQFKRNRHLGSKRRTETLVQLAKMDVSAMPQLRVEGSATTTTESGVVVTGKTGEGDEMQLELHLLLRRRSEQQKWGVHLTSSLHLSAVDDVSVLAEGRIRFGSGDSDSFASQRSLWRRILLREQGRAATAACDGDDTDSQLEALRQFIVTAMGGNETLLCDAGGDDDVRNSVQLPHLQDVFTPSSSSSSSSPHSEAEAVKGGDGGRGGIDSLRTLFSLCKWVLTDINGTPVRERRQVAAVFVQLGKQREVRLRFVATVRNHSSRDYGGGASVEQQLNSDVQLPAVVDLLLSKKGGGNGGWGMKLDSDSLVLLNLSELLLSSHGPRGIDVDAKPPLLSMVKEAVVVDGKYVLCCVNGTTVRSQDDVVECLHQRADRMGRGGKDVLQLHLVLEQHESKQKISTNLPTGAATTTAAKLLSPAVGGGAAERSGETAIHQSGLEGAATASITAGYCGGGGDGESGLAILPPCSPQCVQLTLEQRKRSVITIVVNRTTDAPAGRWGIRVQRGTLRLQHIQRNRHFSFQVFAAKQQQAARVSDTLRFNQIGRGDINEKDGEWTELRSGLDLVSYSHFVYMIVGVNHRRLSSSEELRTSLADAARSSQEAVVLQVQQYRLAYVAVNIERHEAITGGGVLEPLGLRISRDMLIESVSEGSPMARAIMASTHDGCSLRRLIGVSPPGVLDEGQRDDGKVASGGDAEKPTAKWEFNLDEDAQHEDEDGEKQKKKESGSSIGADVGYPSALSTCNLRCDHWNMVDGVALAAAYGDTNAAARFVWRVSYGARAGPLRTPQEVARAFAANVREETLFLQQCVVDG